MKIVVAYRAFDGVAGGVQRMACRLMNEMVARGHDITLLTWDREDATSFYPIDARVEWIKVSIGDYKRKATFSERVRRGARVRNILKDRRPDVIISFMDGAYFAIRPFIMGLGIPLILAERNAPHRYDHLKGGQYRNLIFQTYRFADAVTIQCESFRERYPAFLRSKIVTIPNPVFRPDPEEKKCYENLWKYDKVLLSVGRLGYQKNFSPLIRAFAKLAGECKEWGLVIVGEGEDRADLEAEISGFGLSERILMPGAMTDVWKAYGCADLFCLPSRWEGFPNALAEALIRGVPAVGYKESAGVCDLILEQRNGTLAEGNGDVDSLVKALKPLMQDDVLRHRLAQNAPDTMMEYDPLHVYDMWEGLFKRVGNKGG